VVQRRQRSGSEDVCVAAKHVLPGVGCMERAELCVPVTIRMHPDARTEGPALGPTVYSYLLLLAYLLISDWIFS
jgi:hypothetical protein